jgi:penicillin-binding protein 1B
MVDDEPTTFWFDGRSYQPSNFGHEFYGHVTLRQALAHSMNVATVKVAEMVGFDAVVEMANRAGMNYRIHPTPAVALGAYEITPLEAAGAYTMFANQGVYVKPSFLTMVRSDKGQVLYKSTIEQKAVLDPRVAYVMTNLLEEVLRSGTGAGVRSKFFAPAAGKTGTSRDGWFAGYTTELLCIVWVGFDDNTDLALEGAKSAAPIWAEFMKRALDFREYRDAKEFTAPAGVVSVEIDPQSGMPATPACPKTQTEVYIAGTEPVGTCPLHGGRTGVTNVAGWDTGAASPVASTDGAGGGAAATMAPAEVARRVARQTTAVAAQPPPPAPAKAPQPQKPEEKKSILRRLLGVFK